MKPIARKDDLVIQEVGGEILVYDLKTNKAICLNQTSALVWQNCDGKKDALEIAKEIEKKLGSQVNEDFVWFAVNQLKDESLLDSEISNDRFSGMSRREVVKKIGLTSLVALPIVAAMVAPQAAHAASCVKNAPACVANGNSCSANNQCCSCRCNINGGATNGNCTGN